MSLDDVSAAVIDLGSYEFRAGKFLNSHSLNQNFYLTGYSGEDQPRSVMPSCTGILNTSAESKDNQDVDMDDGAAKKQKSISGYSELGFKRDHMKVAPLYQEDNTMNFDVLEELFDHSIKKNLMLQPKDTPLILTENSMHQKDARLKLTEFMFEKLELPAIFICKDSVLTSYACGRSTSLVLDSGYKTTTATPVHDGYAL